MVLATPTFLKGESFREDFDNFTTRHWLYWGSGYLDPDELYSNISALQQLHPGEGSVVKLNNSDCIKAYGKDIVTDRGPLLLITSDFSASSPGGFLFWNTFAGSNAGTADEDRSYN